MLALFTALLNLIGALLKFAFIPAMIVSVAVLPARPILDWFKVPEDQKQPILAFVRIAGWISTSLVLLGFVFLFGALWLAGKQAGH